MRVLARHKKLASLLIRVFQEFLEVNGFVIVRRASVREVRPSLNEVFATKFAEMESRARELRARPPAKAKRKKEK